jgi:hypothetical protein
MSTATRQVVGITTQTATQLVVDKHYLHRRPPISHSFGLVTAGGDIVGVCTFGTPPSRNAQMSVCPTNPSTAIELNRLWIADNEAHGAASWFVSRCLQQIPPFIVFSYADTKAGHHGGVYRALSWRYGGQTDEDRKTPRFDYVTPGGGHDRHTKASDPGVVRVRRQPKHRYWTTTGSSRERRRLAALCGWDDREYPSCTENMGRQLMGKLA